jgi:hypothetical protein
MLVRKGVDDIRVQMLGVYFGVDEMTSPTSCRVLKPRSRRQARFHVLTDRDNFGWTGATKCGLVG